MPWDPVQYLSFDAERLRPALDLLARVPLEAPESVVDLGCGPGHVARILQTRWPGARLTGVDGSPEMLQQAAGALPGARWILADLADWQPDHPVDLIYANASLHWLDGHDALFPRLLTFLKPGGCLAVQMPRNHGRPSHLAAFEVAEAGPWRERLGPLLRRQPVAEPEAYVRWLEPWAPHLDVWQTDYLHRLEGPDPVAAWTRGSLLVPLMDALRDEERGAFLEAYRQRLREAYPMDGTGRTPFWFQRLFIVAKRETPG
ncbi:MAG: methyltransferase domain-containing protein [Geothrix sp.]|uniref:methyltransferase domain-containing protein n=1 Tax=Geothrix sp. TaxID=1962974 RepID=UPI00183571E0|nr:methyltransferase domain-containing protein [Geothrix sp.]NWJ41319.1 methyltransferase domain-containing protein [Geothrix sp.]WIL20693.1 MAG: methyltransferase domain-containing protein [Geothrix sp.]